MTKMKKTWWTGLAAATLLGLAGKAQAVPTNPAVLSIDVTVTASLSVTVNGAGASTEAVTFSGTPNELLTQASTTTVTNNTGVLSEIWKLSTDAQSMDQTASSPWTLQTSSVTVGQDAYALQAVFGSSNTVAAGCPAATATDWNPPSAALLTTTPLQYTSSVFGDSTLNNNGSYQPDNLVSGEMFAGSSRALCWRIVAPASVTTTDTQEIRIVVTAAL